MALIYRGSASLDRLRTRNASLASEPDPEISCDGLSLNDTWVVDEEPSKRYKHLALVQPLCSVRGIDCVSNILWSAPGILTPMLVGSRPPGRLDASGRDSILREKSGTMASPGPEGTLQGVHPTN